VLLEQFEDKANGGFSSPATINERLIHRPSPVSTTPRLRETAWRPSPCSACISHGESRYALAAERTLAQFHSSVSGQPAGHATLLTALEEHHGRRAR